MSAAHTPGPWRLYPVDEQILGADYSIVVHELNSNASDARLIAAAPDLLAALIAIRQALSGNKLVHVGNSTVHYAYHQAVGAIAKATGAPP